MKIIKRYANRRLYDPETSRTITLDEVAQYVRDGIDIKVMDNTNGEDITRKVLGQTFLKLNDNDRVGNPVLQNQMLKLLIRESKGGVLEVLKKLVLGWLAQHREVLAFCQARAAEVMRASVVMKHIVVASDGAKKPTTMLVKPVPVHRKRFIPAAPFQR